MVNKKAKDALKNLWFYVSVIAVVAIIVLGYKVMVPPTGNTGETINQDAELAMTLSSITVVINANLLRRKSGKI